MVMVKDNDDKLVKMMKLVFNSLRDIFNCRFRCRQQKHEISTLYMGRQRLGLGK